MQFSFTEDQRLLADGVRDFLAGECPPEAVATAWTDGPDAGRWKSLCGLGLVGLLAPEEAGGMGMDEVDLCLPLEAAGWAGLPEPLVEVAAVTVPLLAGLPGEDAASLLAQVCAGDQVVVPALAADAFPAHLTTADRILLQRGSDLALLPGIGDGVRAQPNVDHSRPTVAFVDLDAVGANVLARDVGGQVDLARVRAVWGTSATLVGAARRCIDLATQYAMEREQFGKPIGSFQAVKHHLATAMVEVEFARPLVHRAAWSIANDQPSAARDASMAKAVAAEAAATAAKAALQVHGAIGYTWEHPLHLWMKRIWSLSAAWGSTEQHWQVLDDA